MSIAILFIGQICSGKSTLAKYYCDTNGWSQISFSKYIRDLVRKRGIETSRHNLQQIGNEVFTNTKPSKFLTDVIEFNKPQSDVHVYDNVRHKIMLSEVKKYYNQTITFYLNVDEKVIFDRYRIKNKENIPYKKFKDILNHPIEKGIKDMKTLSDYFLDANLPTNKVIDEVDSILREKKIIV